MPRQRIAIIEPFTVPQLGRRYIDSRDMSQRQRNIVNDLWCAHQSMRLGQIPGNIPPCGDGPTIKARYQRILKRFNRARQTRPNLPLEEWQDEGADRELVTDPLLTKAQIFLGCRDIATGTWIGGVPFSNITIESRTATKITASVFFATATPKHPNFSRSRTNAIATAWLLNNDLPLRNGMILDVVQWDFRLPKAVEAVVLAEPSINRNFTAMGTEFDILGGPGSAEPDTFRRVRRKGIPPAPPDIEPPVDNSVV